MKKIAWATDIHLNFIGLEKSEEFSAVVNSLGVGALLIGGDIGEATDVEHYLRFLAGRVQPPIYFVLGKGGWG